VWGITLPFYVRLFISHPPPSTHSHTLLPVSPCMPPLSTFNSTSHIHQPPCYSPTISTLYYFSSGFSFILYLLFFSNHWWRYCNYYYCHQDSDLLSLYKSYKERNLCVSMYNLQIGTS